MEFILAFFIGIILGILYFGGLYLTVQKIYKSKNPSFLMVISLVIRMGGLVAAFFYISKNGYKNILFTLLGIIVARFIMIYVARKQKINLNKGGD